MGAENLASEILKDLMNPEQTTEVRQLFIGNLPFRVRWQDIKDLFRKAGNVVRADVALNHENRSKGHGTVLFTTVEDAQKAMKMFHGYKWQGRILEVRGDRSFVDTETQESPAKMILKRSDSNIKSELEVQQNTHENEKSIHQEPTDMEEQAKEVPTGKATEDSIQYKSTSLSPSSSTSNPSQKTKVEEPSVSDDCKQLFVGNIPFHCETPELKELFQTCGRILKVDIVVNFEGRSRGFGTVLFNSHEDAKRAIEKFDGYEFHNRLLRVHFDKFAASHQRLREQEAETYGQRQLQDPYSVQLLKETYLPQQTTSYNQLINGLLKPSTTPMPTAQQYNNPNITGYYNATSYMQPTTSAVYPMGTPTTSNNMVHNNLGMYQQQVYPQSSVAYDSRERYSGEDSYLNSYPQQNVYQAWMNSPSLLQQYPQQPLYEDRLSSSFDRLSLSNTNNQSAGLKNSSSPLWDLYK